MRRRAVASLLVAMAVTFGFGAGDAASRATAAPATVTIEVIGAGKVTGLGINCGLGSLSCYAAYGSGTANPTFTATHASGWTLTGWDDDAAGCGAATTCTVTLGGDQTVTAVFSKPGVVSTSTFGVTVTSPAHGTVTNGSASHTIDCPTTSCSLTELTGSTLTVTETPNPGWFFGGWGGACGGTRVSCAVYLSGDRFVSADFVDAAITHTLTLQAVGDGSVSVNGTTCGAGSTCTITEPANATVVVTESAQSGYAFTEWSGGACTGSQSTCTVQMNDDRTVIATFEQLVPLLITVNGNGQVLGPDGANITCGPGPTTCDGAVPPNSTLKLTAAPGAGSSVTWSGCTSAAGTICNVSVLESPISITATFSGGTPPPSSFALSVSVTGNGTVTSTTGTDAIYCTAAGGSACSASVQQNATVTLTADPASGLTGDFTGWTGACASVTARTCTFTMNGAKTVGATFTGTGTTYTLTAQVLGTGSGTVSGAGLNCTAIGGTGCSAAQAATASVTVTATASFGSTFTGWGGACSGTTNTCKVSMTAAKNVTATFTRSTPGELPLTITVTGAGKVKSSGGECTSTSGKTVRCTQLYAADAKVTLTATPASGFSFAGWKGACTGKKTTCTVTMSAAQAVTATFAKQYLVPGKKPTVSKVEGGFKVTLFFTANEKGTLKLTGVRSGAKVVVSGKKVPVGAGKLVFTVKKTGRYLFTLTLLSKSGAHSVRWVVTIS
jgi:Divergent InlB B-repeat domain